MINSGLMSSNSDQWETPQKLFDELNQKYNFSVDVCALPENAKCEKYFTPDFAMALSYYLAFLAAPSLGMASEQGNVLKIYGIMLNRAVTSNANEDNDKSEKESDIIEARSC